MTTSLNSAPQILILVPAVLCAFSIGNYILYSLLELTNCLYVIRVPTDFSSRESIRSSV